LKEEEVFRQRRSWSIWNIVF